MLRFLFVEIVLCVSTVVEIGFLVLDRKVQSLYFAYIACAGERLLLLEVEYRERSGRNNRSDLTERFGPTSGGIQSVRLFTALRRRWLVHRYSVS